MEALTVIAAALAFARGQAPKLWTKGKLSPARPTVMNAILDVLSPLGVGDLPMPVTFERMWPAIGGRPRG